MTFVSIAAMFLAGQAQVAYPPVVAGKIEVGKPFNGGPYAGLSLGAVAVPKGEPFLALKPSQPGVSPVSARDAAAVSAFVAGHANPSAGPLAPFFTKKPAMINCHRPGEACQVSQADPLIFGEPVQANTPYALGSGKVRIEWLYGSAVWYISYLTLKNGKIASIQTQPGWLPLRLGKPN